MKIILSFTIFVIIGLTVNPNYISAQTSSANIVHLSAIDQELRTPIRLAVDKMNNIYVSDASNNSIQKFDAGGYYLESIITGGSPLSIAINNNDEIFVGEESGKILRISGGTVSTFFLDNIYPSDMDFSPEGNLYIVDSKNKRVIVLDSNANIILDFGSGTLLYPTTLAYDALNERIYIGEHGGTHSSMMGSKCWVWVYDIAGNYITKFGSGGVGDGKFQRIQGVEVGKCGNIYVNDPYLGNISVFNDSYTFITKFGVYGDSLSQLNLPMDVVFDSQERIIVTSANTSKIEMFNVSDTLPSSFIQYSEPEITCLGGASDISVNFTGTAPWTFTYTVDGLNPTNITTSDNPYTLSATEAGIYEITSLSDANYTGTCFTGYAKVNLNMLPSPTSTITTINETICDGEEANVEISFTGNAPFTFTYTQSGLNPQTITTSNSNYILPLTEAGIYEITNMIGDGCPSFSNTGYAYINVNPLPTSSIFEGNNQFEICQGETLDLHLNFTGTAPWDLTYNIDGQNPVTISGIMTNNYTLSATEGGIYEVELISDAFCNNNQTIGSPEIIVHELPTATIPTLDSTFCTGNYMQLPLSLTGAPPFNFSYSYNNNSTTTALNMYNNPYFIYAYQTGTYQILSVSDSYCDGTFTGQTNITIVPQPEALFTFTDNSLDVSFTNISIDADSYFWDFGDSQTSNLIDPDHTYLTPGSYIVSLTATNICGDNIISDTITVYLVSDEETTITDHFKIYPNPTDGRIYLEIDNFSKGELILDIYDFAGKLVYNHKYKHEALINYIDISYLSEGVYTLRLIEKENIKTVKLILKK